MTTLQCCDRDAQLIDRDAQLADRDAKVSPLSFIGELTLNGNASALRTLSSARRWASLVNRSSTATLQRHDRWAEALPMKLNSLVMFSLQCFILQFATLLETHRLPPNRRPFTFHPVGDPLPPTQLATLCLPQTCNGYFFFFPFKLIFLLIFV